MATDNIAEQALAADRLDRAVRLRAKGAHWGEVARECGYPSPAAALRAVGEAMAAATQRAEETVDSMRDTAQLRYESLLRDTLRMLGEDAPMDLEGNQPDDRAVKLRAVDEARRLVEAITKLQRLDVVKEEVEGPMRIQIVGLDPSAIV